MRFSSAAAVAGATITLLAGCSGGAGPASVIPGLGPAAARSRPFAADLTPRKLAPLVKPRTPYPSGSNGLYVIDSSGVQVISNKFNKVLGTIGDVSCVSGDALDAAGNLYVADSCDDDIHEFAVGATSPTFTYSAGITDPGNVSVDSSGNVYEVDRYDTGLDAGVVNEYAQGSNAILYSCSPQEYASVEGVAVDKNNDVFVDYTIGDGEGLIDEYKGGLSGCRETVLGVAPGYFPRGMVVDKKNDLVLCVSYLFSDFSGSGAVEVIAPPYSSVTTPLGAAYNGPVSVSLNRENDLAFVSDGAGVIVLNYPEGSTYTTLSSGSLGISAPSYAVDGPNAVY